MTIRTRFQESPEFVVEAEKALGMAGILRLQLELVENPERGDLIVGTGGLRKIRAAASGRGKRGGARVIYLYLRGPEIIFLFALYTKNRKESLTGAEKNAMRVVVQRIKSQYEE